METGVILNKFKENFQKYSNEFSSGKLWEKLKKHTAKLGARIVYTILKLYYLTLDPHVSKNDKIIITAALGYLILPIDLIPDFLLGGFLDDGAILNWTLNQMEGIMSENTISQAQEKMMQWFSPETVKSLDN